MIPFIDLKREYALVKSEVQSSIENVFDKGIFILGENVRLFEEEFAKYIGCECGIGVANGTDAISIAIRACGIGKGDEVITVPNTAVPTVSAIVSAGAKPVFVDICADTYLIDVNQIEKAITKNTKAVIPVHLYGQMADMPAIMEIAGKHCLKVIEDCAQSAGSELGGVKAGAFGDASAFSFYPTKNLGAYGDGGMILTSDPQIAKNARLIRMYGFEDKYVSVIEGVNSRLDEIQASILREKLKCLDKFNDERINLALYYNAAISNRHIKTPSFNKSKHVYHLYVVKAEKRDELAKYLYEKGIQTLIHYPVPVHLQKSYKYLGYKEGCFPVCEQVCGEILSLPLFIGLTDREQETIVFAINHFILG